MYVVVRKEGRRTRRLVGQLVEWPWPARSAYSDCGQIDITNLFKQHVYHLKSSYKKNVRSQVARLKTAVA